MLTGAILLVGTSLSTDDRPWVVPDEVESHAPLALLEVLGRSIFQRTVERLVWCGVVDCAVVTPARFAPAISRQLASLGPQVRSAVRVHIAESRAETCQHVRVVASEFSNKGIETALVCGLSAYAEFDPEDIASFFKASGQDAVGVIDTQGDLDIWLARSEALSNDSLHLDRFSDREFGRSYLFCGYACRMWTIQGLRRFVVDMFHGRCEARPEGLETRPGVWIGEGAQVHRQARVVAPAYIGRHSKVGAAALITRCSSIECNSHVNDHTALEDSSVLEDTYVGAGLDVMHCVIHGNHLEHLRRNVSVDIEDETLIGTNQVSAIRRVLRRYRDGKASSFVQNYPVKAAQTLERPIGKA